MNDPKPFSVMPLSTWLQPLKLGESLSLSPLQQAFLSSVLSGELTQNSLWRVKRVSLSNPETIPRSETRCTYVWHSAIPSEPMPVSMSRKITNGEIELPITYLFIDERWNPPDDKGQP